MADENDMVYAPDMLPDTGDKVFCFIVPERVCGPECMAYAAYGTEPPRNSDLDANQVHCTLLVSADRLARHAVIIASILAQGQKKQHTASQDKKRQDNTPKTGPFAGPSPLNPFPVGKP